MINILSNNKRNFLSDILIVLSNFLYKPIRENTISLVFLSLLLYIPEILPELLIGSPYIAIRTFAYSFTGNFLLSTSVVYIGLILISIVSRISKRLGKTGLLLLHLVIYIFFCTDIFLILHFGTTINTNILQLIDETNPQESSEFISTYLFTYQTFIVVILTLSALISECLLTRHNNNISLKFRKIFIRQKYIVFALFLYSLTSLGWTLQRVHCFNFDYKKNLDDAIVCGINSSSVFTTYVSFAQYFEERNYFEKCANIQKKINSFSIEIKNDTIPNIVIIIGESFNKHHSSLYGYDKQTNPRLGNIQNLYIFKDVISSMNVTSPSFKNFLSTASVDDEDEWCDTPLFPAIFKKVGYNVVFYSNQFVKSPNMEAWDASCGFFNHPDIEPMLFTSRNSQKFEYDEQLINDYKKNRKVIEVNDKPNLILFHLMGQHMAPAKRIPNNFKKSFVEKDYTHRTELTPKQRQEVADYDNATLYNDSMR